MRRVRFGMLWAEADPEENLRDIAIRAGYSESVANSGQVAAIARDPDVVRIRDRRLSELQRVTSVTVEDTLLGLREIAQDPKAPMKDRVAARRIILAWYAPDKGTHRDNGRPGGGLPLDPRREFERELLGVTLDESEE